MLRPQTECNVLQDGSFSWEQPPSRGIAGWEGRCGQTAAANLITTYGNQLVSPEEVIDAAWDGTPGSKPSTVLRAVNTLLPRTGYRRRFKLDYSNSLGVVRPAAPIITMLQWDSVQLHWVTVVDYNDNWVRFNHWGKSESWKRDKFERQWALKTAPWYGQLVHWAGWLSAYTTIRRV